MMLRYRGKKPTAVTIDKGGKKPTALLPFTIPYTCVALLLLVRRFEGLENTRNAA
jgi:hypothetical protein